MRNQMVRLLFFAAGIGVGAVWLQPSSGQTAGQTTQPANRVPALRLNHVGIYAKNYQEAMRFYTETMGLKEAFTIKDASGNPTLSYLHITKDTFLEVQPASPERPAGLSHIGIWPEDLNATVAALRQHGLQMVDPRTGANKTAITNATGPDGVRWEFLDFLPGSLPRQAIESYK